ncbi:hypothetical protein POTOM_043555 [Populus tomentosa]|uniref:Pectinesterase inhibitor domain-containing protein n=1 Tax=Populus tomentosa TaxID=118781 RepID=A0A8X8CGS8_POPTO|nr:hypothetical protein POTOM_043555 [Populus tomentosa]
MASLKSLSSPAALLLLLIALAVQTHLAHSQICTSQLNSLNCNMTASATLSRSRLASLLNAIFHLSLAVQDKHEAVVKRVKKNISVIGTSIIEAYDPPIFLSSFKCVPIDDL